MNGRALLLSIAITISILVAGCSSGPGVSIAITTPPPANLPASLTASIAATVTNDPTNSGVDWGCTPAGACGTFTPAHTASGAMTVYTAPGAAGSVVITAASTKNPAVHQQADVTIGSGLTINLTTPPPANMGVNLSASIAATVTNDPANAGVDWSCTPVGTCGTFTPAHTASGALTSYTAPGTAGAVVITAASTTEPAVHQPAPVNILSIQITTPPPASLQVNLSTSIAATVTNDPANAGVDWSCTPVGTCGTFTPAHTASGAQTSYMAPRTAGPVVITAASTTVPALFQPAPVNITPIATAGDLSGTYTFFANGTDNAGNPISVAGSIVLDGAAITGEEDYFNAGTGTVCPAEAITSGSISVGSDGRGSLTLNPTACAPTATYSITVVNNKHILISEFDATATANGSLDLQTAPISVPSGGNAFALFDAFDFYALGGVLTSDGTKITASTVDDDIDTGAGGVPTYGFSLTCPCAITAPDPAGRGTITLEDASTTFGPVHLAYYVVGPEAFYLIEYDNNVYLSGAMYGQGAGGFSAASLGKAFVFGQSGVASSTFAVYAAAGQFTGDGTSKLSGGVADVNLGDGAPVQAGSLAGSSYSVSANGYGSITLSGANTDGLANFGIYLVDPAINVTDPNNASGGGGAVMLDLDTNAIGIGIVVPQTAGATFTGNYAFGQNGFFSTTPPAPAAIIAYGLIGQIVSSGTSFTGLADYNQLTISQSPAVTVTGSYTADAANPGRAKAQVTIAGAASPNNITTYQASNGLLLDVDVDATNVALGITEQQQ